MYEALILKEIFELLESKAKVPPEWVAYLQEKLPAISLGGKPPTLEGPWLSILEARISL